MSYVDGHDEMREELRELIRAYRHKPERAQRTLLIAAICEIAHRVDQLGASVDNLRDEIHGHNKCCDSQPTAWFEKPTAEA